MSSILIAMPKLEDAEKIAKIIRRQGMPYDISICETGSEVLRVVSDRDYGLLICGKKVRDMSSTELIGMLPAYFGAIVLTKDESLEIEREDVEKLILPFRPSDLIYLIERIVQDLYRRLKQKPKVVSKRKQEEQKIIDKAKYVLMNRNGFSEEEAYRYIQKNSMDFGRKLIDSARMILSLYGNE